MALRKNCVSRLIWHSREIMRPRPLVYSFSFTMPEKDVNIAVTMEEALNKISRTSDEHADIWMLNRLYPDGYNPEIEEGIENEYDQKVCMGLFEDHVFFRILSVPGYSYETPQVKGTITGNIYYPEYVNHQVHGWCYSLIMPAEPLDITVSVNEEIIYEGKEFVGTYNGFWIKVRSGSLIYPASSTSGLTILMSFRLNGTLCYYWYDHSNTSLSPVDVEFESGSSLADNGASAYVRLDGQVILKYSVADGSPVFAAKGSEAGTYTGSEGDLYEVLCGVS